MHTPNIADDRIIAKSYELEGSRMTGPTTLARKIQEEHTRGPARGADTG